MSKQTYKKPFAYSPTMPQYLDIVVVQERLSSGKPVFVAHCTTLGIVSQGDTREEAERNVREAIDVYLEECPEKLVDIPRDSKPTFSFVEVRDAKAS